MWVCVYLLVSVLHFSEACVDAPLITINGYPGGSVLLPCFCKDIQYLYFTWEHMSPGPVEELWPSVSTRYIGRVESYNRISPQNFSLRLSELTGKDMGIYRCKVSQLGAYREILLNVKEIPKPTTTTTKPTTTRPTTTRPTTTKPTTTKSITRPTTHPTACVDAPQMTIDGYPGGSVLLPCFCNDTRYLYFTWEHMSTNPVEELWPSVSTRYIGRVESFNRISPRNFSLRLSELTGKDMGIYRCKVSQLGAYREILLNVKEIPKPTTTKPTTTRPTTTKPTTTKSITRPTTHPTGTTPPTIKTILAIFIPIGVLGCTCLVVPAILYWIYRGQKKRRVENGEGQEGRIGRQPEEDNENDPQYCNDPARHNREAMRGAIGHNQARENGVGQIGRQPEENYENDPMYSVLQQRYDPEAMYSRIRPNTEN